MEEKYGSFFVSPDNPNLVARQSEILTVIDWPCLHERIKDEIAKQQRKLEEKIPPPHLINFTKGFVFEELVRADKRIVPVPESPLGGEVRKVMMFPKEYGFEDLKWGTCPDGLVTDDAGMVTGLLECKSGEVTPYAMTQLVSYERDVRQMIMALKDPHRVKTNLGRLPEITGNLDGLSVAPSLLSVLAVPRDTDLATNPKYAEWGSIWKIFREKYTVKKSPFASWEIFGVARSLLEQQKTPPKVGGV